MAKRSRNVDPSQRDLFDYLRELQQDPTEHSSPAEGSANIAGNLRIALCDDVRDCPFSRWEIAGRMSHLVGVEISKYTIDAWTAESKDGHRMPAEYVPAWCRVTGSRRTIQILNEASGTFTLPGPDALRAEIQKYAEQERRARAEKRKRELFLLEIEGSETDQKGGVR